MTNSISKYFSKIKGSPPSVKGRSSRSTKEPKARDQQGQDPDGCYFKVSYEGSAQSRANHSTPPSLFIYPSGLSTLSASTLSALSTSEKTASETDCFDSECESAWDTEEEVEDNCPIQTHTRKLSDPGIAKHKKESEDLEKEKALNEFDPEFTSQFKPQEMRCLALVAHNHMKPAMKAFVQANKNVLKKFMLTGTNTTMTMLKEVFGDDPSVVYGPTCTSGPLGGDAELVSLMVTGRLGACIFFTDPMSAHPHTADIECLNRQANVHNVIMCPNPTTAGTALATCRYALEHGLPGLVPSFFQTLESPSVDVYKESQVAILKKNMEGESK